MESSGPNNICSFKESRAAPDGSIGAISQALGVLLLLVATLILAKLCQLSRKRRAWLAHFARAHLPVAGEPKLFNGHLSCTLLRDDNIVRLHQYHEQLGKSVALFYGPDPWLVTVDLALIQRVFVTEGDTHVDATLLRLPFVREINQSLAQVRGDEWRHTRRLMAPSFTSKCIKSDSVFEEISRVCELFLELLASNESQSAELDVHYAFKRYSLEVIFRVAFGQSHYARLLPDERDPLIDWLDRTSQLVVSPLVHWAIMFGPLARLLLGVCARFTLLGSCIRFVHAQTRRHLESRRASAHAAAAAASQPRKLIDSLIESFETGRMADATLEANLFFILLAGFETSASTLTFMFWLLARHPDKQEQLRAELTQMGVQSTYLEWVVFETLRLYPAVPAPVGRILEHDIEHEGRHIKRGLTVVASIWSLHRWPEYWGADVHHFRPERFGPEEAKLQARWPLRFFAFAAGPRYCIGKHLALAEIKALAARLLTNYRVALPANCSQDRPLDAVTPNMIHFIIRQPVKLTFTRLETNNKRQSTNARSVEYQCK